MNPTLTTEVAVAATATVAMVIFNSFFEWLVHGPLMHGRFATKFLSRTHHDHHDSYGAEAGYQNHDHGPHVHLPWWAGAFIIALLTGVGAALSLLTGFWSIAWCAGVVSALYYWLYQYVHTCIHVPTGRWFEGTRAYRYLKRWHHVHHAATDREWERMTHICVLFPLADWVIDWFRALARRWKTA